MMQNDKSFERAAAQQAVAQLRTEWAAVLNVPEIFSAKPPPVIPADYDRTNIFRVCQHSDFPALLELIDQGFDIHALEELAMQVAAQHGQTAMVLFFLEDHADLHADDDAALRWCSTAETADLLVKWGAPVEKMHPEQRAEYDAYKQEQTRARKTAVQAERVLTTAFNAATWAGHVPEMRMLWEQVPEVLQSELDFRHVLAETQVQTLKQRKSKVIIIK